MLNNGIDSNPIEEYSLTVEAPGCLASKALKEAHGETLGCISFRPISLASSRKPTSSTKCLATVVHNLVQAPPLSEGTSDADLHERAPYQALSNWAEYHS